MLTILSVLHRSGVWDTFSGEDIRYPPFERGKWGVCSFLEDMVEEYHVWEGAARVGCDY